MKVTELINQLNVFDSRGECTRWIVSGAVKINGRKVTLGENFDVENIKSIQIGNKIKFEKKAQEKIIGV